LISPCQNPAAVSDLFGFLKVMLDCRMFHGWYMQWWMHLGASLSILSNHALLMWMVRFAKQHGKTLNLLHGTFSPTCHRDHVLAAADPGECGGL
jgi:hypothetical protein